MHINRLFKTSLLTLLLIFSTGPALVAGPPPTSSVEASSVNSDQDAAPSVSAGSIRDIRTGEHERFHRLVIEVSGDNRFSVLKKKGYLDIRVDGALYAGTLGADISTEVIDIRGLRRVEDGSGAGTSLIVALKKRSLVRQAVWKEPRRLVLDFYPAGTEESPLIKTEEAKGPGKSEKAEAPAEAVKKAPAVGAPEGTAPEEKPRVKRQAPVPAESAVRKTAEKASAEQRRPEGPDGEARAAARKAEKAAAVAGGSQGEEGAAGAPDAGKARDGGETTTLHVPISSGKSSSVLEKEIAEALALNKEEVRPKLAETGDGAPSLLDEKGEEALAAGGFSPDPAIVTFNDGWRWEYRKMVIGELRKRLYDSDDTERDIIRHVLDIKAPDRTGVLIEGRALARRLRSQGEAERAGLIEEILKVYERGEGVLGLDGAVRTHPGAGKDVKHLGWYVLGSYSERAGLDAEAYAHFKRLEEDTNDGLLKGAALFSMGRLRYFHEKYGEAGRLFRQAAEGGFGDSKRWLANVLLIRGLKKSAASLYGSDPAALSLDPVTALSIGDLLLSSGDYAGARGIYSGLHSRFSGDDFLDAFFTVRGGDTFVAEGRVDMALKAYSNAERTFKGEGRAMALMSTADLLVAEGGFESMLKAMEAYESVSAEELAASEYAYVNLIDVRMKLGRYGQALDAVGSFSWKYTTSHLRDDVAGMKGEIVYSWVKELYEAGDHYGVIKVASEYGSRVPFGKKSEMFLRMGRSFSELSLISDAVRPLMAASELGSPRVAEEATIELARVYIMQRDGSAAARLLEGFEKRFPSSERGKEAEALRLKASYVSGDYARYAEGAPAGEEGGDLYAKARSLASIGRHGEAAGLFDDAAGAYAGGGDSRGVVKAIIGAGDSLYELKRYDEAVKRYLAAAGKAEAAEGDGRSWALLRAAECQALLGRAEEADELLMDVKASGGPLGASAGVVARKTDGFF